MTRSPAVKGTPPTWQRAYQEKFIRVSGFWAVLRFQDRNCCAQMRGRIVKKFDDTGMAFERLLHDAALYPRSTAMHETHFAQSSGMCLVEVLFDDRGDVARSERVEVELAFDGNPQRVLILHR